jgi:hypothetical protein
MAAGSEARAARVVTELRVGRLEKKQISNSWYWLKEAQQGVVVAQVATFGVKDLDGDVIEPGAIGTQRVRISAFGHESWNGALPVGTGTINEENGAAVARLNFFMDTTHGLAHFETIKGLGSLAEWSIAFDVVSRRAPTEEERGLGVRRVLKKLKVHEVSPVLRGAGSTRTLDVKCDACGVVVPGREELQRAQRALLAAGKVLKGCVPEDTEVQELARFACYVGHLLNGCPGRIREPAIKWFDADFMPGTAGYMLPKAHDTWVLRGLSGEALVRTVLHEAKHHEQSDPRSPGAEREAGEFARRWMRPVWQAYRYGQADRISITRNREPPFTGGPYRDGDVVFQLGRCRAWVLNRRAKGQPWQTIG